MKLFNLALVWLVRLILTTSTAVLALNPELNSDKDVLFILALGTVLSFVLLSHDVDE